MNSEESSIKNKSIRITLTNSSVFQTDLEKMDRGIPLIPFPPLEETIYAVYSVDSHGIFVLKVPSRSSFKHLFVPLLERVFDETLSPLPLSNLLHSISYEYIVSRPVTTSKRTFNRLHPLARVCPLHTTIVEETLNFRAFRIMFYRGYFFRIMLYICSVQ